MTEIKIQTGVFDDVVWIVAPCDHKQAVEWLKKKKITDFDHIDEYKEARGMCARRTKRSASIIFLKKRPVDADTIALLCHEAIHAANQIMSDSGVRDKGDEATCYLAHFIVRKALGVFLKKVA